MSGAEPYFFGAGVAAEVARSVDWASTPLGTPDRWPSSLRTILATIFHSRHPMFLWWGPELVQFYNDAYLPSFGVGKHPAAMGQRGRDCWPEIWSIIGPQIDDVMRRAVPSWNEDQLVPILRNGRIEEVYWTYGYSPIFDETGAVGGTLVVCTETTARVIAERRLGLLRSLGDALLATQEPADTMPLAAAQLGTDVEDLPFAVLASGAEAPLFVGVDEAAAARIQKVLGPRAAVARTITLPEPIAAPPWPDPVTTVHVEPIAESGYVAFGVSPRLPFDERYARFLAQIARQIEAITEQVRVRTELQVAARAKDEFLATMSHELRTPLNAILGWARILKNDWGDLAKVQKGIAVIERNAEAQARLVSDLLDVSRIISGKLELTLAALDVASALAAAVDVVRPTANAKGVLLQTDITADVGATVADPDRFQQILWNLLSNAVRFTPRDGTVRLSAERVGSWLRIEVADTGAGIRSEHLAQIFERFRQVDATTTRQHGGLGLGLAIVRYLVEAHGGSVSARSEGAGQGTTFDVLLPIRAVQPVAPAESTVTPSATAAGRPAPNLQRARVLALDDEGDSLELLREVLEQAGAVVTTVSNVAQALAEPGPFDIIISDIGMPAVDGYDFIRRIRARDAGGDVPAIALTAFARAEDAARARRAGFQQHLAKPVDPKELVATVMRWIGA